METYLKVQAAEIACDRGNEREDKAARKSRECTECMIAASAAGHRHAVSLLIRNGADLNGKDHQNQTALMRAVSRGDIKMARFLLRLGGDVNTRGINGDAALNISIRRGNEEMLRLLLNAGADVSLKKWDGIDAWDVAKAWKRTKFITLLDEASSQPVCLRLGSTTDRRRAGAERDPRRRK